MKKILSMILSIMMLMSVVAFASAESEGMTLYYPSYMQESEGETLVLDEKPERIVSCV